MAEAAPKPASAVIPAHPDEAPKPSDPTASPPAPDTATATADRPKDEQPKADRPQKLTDRMTMDAVADLVEVLRLWRLYENPRLRYRFREEAEKAGFDIGKSSTQGTAQMHEVGPLEALFQSVPGLDTAPGSVE